jgi:uncharacterized membrane protein YkoI
MKRVVNYTVAAGALLAGALVWTSGCKTLEWGEGKEQEQKITMNDLPAAVKTAAEKEIAGGKVYEVEKEMKNGQAVYEIVYDQAGAKMELKYDESGKLLKKDKD